MQIVLILMGMLTLLLAPTAYAEQRNIWITSEESWISAQEMVSRLEGKAVVFLGEIHADQRHHEAQVRFLELLSENFGTFNLAMEPFLRESQSSLDLFIKGWLTEQELLKEVDWERVWGFDYLMYRPLVELIKAKGGRVLGIGVELSMVRDLLKKGGLFGGDIPVNPIYLRGPSAYREDIRPIYDAHRVHYDRGDFDTFFKAQALRDELMAIHLLEAFLEDPKRTVVLMGNQHVLNYWGVPHRFLRHLGLPVATVVMYSRDQIPKKRPYQNEFVWVVE